MDLVTIATKKGFATKATMSTKRAQKNTRLLDLCDLRALCG